jgi:hypothetical protein
MSLNDLASAAVVPSATVWDYEAEVGIMVRPADLDAIQHALEAAGVEFITDGVRLRKGGK